MVGHAKAITPVLPVPLTGPAYFVSHGGEAFPCLIIVLQGDGVTVDLVGSTFISKTGITSSHVQDGPRRAGHELRTDAPPRASTPRSPRTGTSARAKLAMPTEFVAQNGAVVQQNTHIEVSGCPKAKKKVKKHRKGKSKHKGKKS